MLAHLTPQSELQTIDPDYLALCIAEQIVRVKMAVEHWQLPEDRAIEASMTLAKPLMSLARTLGVDTLVKEHVTDALPGAPL